MRRPAGFLDRAARRVRSWREPSGTAAASRSSSCTSASLRRGVQDLAGSAALFLQGLALQPDHLNLNLGSRSRWPLPVASLKRCSAGDQVLARTPQLTAAQLGKARAAVDGTSRREPGAVSGAAGAGSDRSEIRRGWPQPDTCSAATGRGRRTCIAACSAKMGAMPKRGPVWLSYSRSRWEFVALLGATETVGSGLSPTGGLRASYVPPPSRCLPAISSTHRCSMVIWQQPGLRQRAEAEVLLHLTPRIDFSLGYQLAVWPNTLRHALPLGGSLKLGRSWVALAGLRQAWISPVCSHSSRSWGCR